MPSLNGLTCHVERGPDNSPLHEYGTKYGDGIVATYISVPGKPCPFSIHLTSNRYIAPGLAMFVYIDGVAQCNRNRLDLVPPTLGSSRANTEIDFRVREKETRYEHEFLIGREWRFEKLQTAEADEVAEVDQAFRENVGTIEVVILRCQSDQFWGGSIEMGNPKMKAKADAASQAANQLTSSSSKLDYRSDSGSGNTVKDPFLGGLDGAFDGPADEKEQDERKNQSQHSTPYTVSHFVPVYTSSPASPSWIPGAFPPSSGNLPGVSPVPIQAPGSTGPLYQMQPQVFYGGPFWHPSSYSQNIQSGANPSPFQAANTEGWSAGNAATDAWTSSSNTKPTDASAVDDNPQKSWAVDEINHQHNPWGEGSNKASGNAWATQTGGVVSWADNSNNIPAGDWNTSIENNQFDEQKALKNVSWDDSAAVNTTQPSNSENKQSEQTTSKASKKGKKKRKGKSKATSATASASTDPQTDSKRRASVSPPPTPYLKDYWSLWNKSEPIQRPVSPLPADINANNLLPEDPVPRLPAAAARTTSATHVVQPGVGSFAPRPAKRPIYADNLRSPYAVFVFKYRSAARIAELFGGDAAAAEAPIARTSFRGRMRAWSKDEIVEQLVRAKKLAGYETDESLEESEDEDDDEDDGGDESASAEKKDEGGAGAATWSW